ncbi:ABC transporter ATP-binding protein [Alkalihalobacterium chitinilyticum]|uniref:ABC transporter ATP-binding protein n=1 Tax=Alkalihalobacterium chitinilyticum TaxID=2980103 RepID=A0ABT5VLG5_9BACI|nr:ABC transporter ATP-binding protein [Alkalihalobacterium chitinilyticum]MDE5416269.1 ABC transporter ATP-binding protein [Alkalihalobacterium chitinilyticum]
MLELKDVSVDLKRNNQSVTIVESVNFELQRGEILGMIGESGSGKSMTAKAILDILPSQAFVSQGDILFEGKSLLNLTKNEWRRWYGKEISVIMQNTTENLNPVMKIGPQMLDTYLVHHKVSKKKGKERVVEVLDQVGIRDAAKVFDSYPHELSGGMKQRVMIGIAIINHPKVIIADEPTTALDATICKQILDLLLKLRDELGIAILFISHDIHVIEYISDSLFVLYGGLPLEKGPSQAVLSSPLHPYTEALLHAVPSVKEKKSVQGIPGKVPTFEERGTGCIYRERCHYAVEACHLLQPSMYIHEELEKRRCACHAPLIHREMQKETERFA